MGRGPSSNIPSIYLINEIALDTRRSSRVFGESIWHRVPRAFEIRFQGCHNAFVFFRDEGCCQTFFASSTCSSNTMGVVLNGTSWQIIINNLKESKIKKVRYQMRRFRTCFARVVVRTCVTLGISIPRPATSVATVVQVKS